MKKIIFFLLLTFLFYNLAATEKQEKKFNSGELILEHLGDEHSWHILTYRDNKYIDHDIAIPLPVIVISKGRMDIFMSSKFKHGHATYKNYRLGREEDGESLKGKIINTNTNEAVWDFSITKNVAGIFIVAGLIVFVVLKARNIAKKRQGKEPKGMQTIVEYVVTFIRDDIAIPSIGKERYEKYFPFLITVFLFIFLCNISGLLPFFPGGANITGNIAVTLVLALFTFFITQFSTNKHFWKHIFNMPGVPWWLKFPLPLMPLVEVLGIFTKPFALTVRLFANITAGHVILLSFMCILFIIGEQNVVIGYGMSFLPVLFSVFMTAVEILVAFIQAYVFTLLSAIYFGMAKEEEHLSVE
ncbi:MAG: F0F1 ATP synthase subunit A [Bacteroidales bacterium]|jgi:F-type H+-transporting ATPase subunit a|nr:F0F1 ATP synthase subunit A [Bacteroidales bacterium]